MVLTAEQKSLFLFEELMNSYGLDLENVKKSELQAPRGPETNKAQFDGQVQSQQRSSAIDALLHTDEAERLKNENKKEIKAAADDLRNAGDNLESQHGEELKVLNSELQDLFENCPNIKYSAFEEFLKQKLQEGSSSEVSAFVLVVCSSKALAKIFGATIPWRYMRPFIASEFPHEAERYYDRAANGSHI